MAATIERRLLINYRADPEVLGQLVPEPFRPQLVGGVGVAGICLIRLGDLRPAGLPAVMGITTENAAHRIAVEWDTADGPASGVYIPRRDTSSRLAALVGGRFFPGEHHRAHFSVQEGEGRYQVAFSSLDRTASVSVTATCAVEHSARSVFDSLADASAFFAGGSVGYSATRRRGDYDGLALSCDRWAIEPLTVQHVSSSFFDDSASFPVGSIEYDSAFLMHDLYTRWAALDAPEQLLRRSVTV